MKRDIHYEIMKHTQMHFIYAAFFEVDDDIYIKVGRSTRPYQRVAALTQGVPFVLSRAVFAQAGSIENASSIERSLFKLLEGFRMRGEWYRFKHADAATFRTTIAASFTKFTGRKLVWSTMDADKLKAEIADQGAKFTHRKRPDDAT